MKPIFYGWWIVLATSLIHIWGAEAFYYSFTAFFNPIVNEFGWSYAITSFAASLRSIEGGIASPIVGFAADRYGAKRLLVLGSLMGGVGFILLSRIHSLWSFYLIFVFLSVGSSLLFPVPGWTAVANWFAKKRGTALYAGGIEELMNDLALLIFMVYAVRDSLAVLKRRGVEVVRYPDARPYLQGPIDEFTMNYANSILNTTYGQRVIKAGHFRTNMDEMKRFYFDVVATAKELGVRTPHLNAMREKIESLPP